MLPIAQEALPPMEIERRRRSTHRGHRRSYSAPITNLPLIPFNDQMQGNLAHIQHLQGPSRWPHPNKHMKQPLYHDQLCLENTEVDGPSPSGLCQLSTQPSVEKTPEENSRSDSGTDGSQSTAPMSDVLVFLELQETPTRPSCWSEPPTKQNCKQISIESDVRQK